MQDLKQNSYFGNKELISLCLSHEGYKQPQQLLVLSYFLSIGQQFDLVVNIDGFNEVTLSSLNNEHGLDISMPSVMHMDPLINLVNLIILEAIRARAISPIWAWSRNVRAMRSASTSRSAIPARRRRRHSCASTRTIRCRAMAARCPAPRCKCEPTSLSGGAA